MSRNFREMLEAQWSRGNFVCVGLDSEYDKLPESMKHVCFLGLKLWKRSPWRAVLRFNKAIVKATKNLVCAFKPNIAFYEALGEKGLRALQKTVAYINKVAPAVPVILDAKRADIGNTNNGYVEMAFNFLRVDAITVHPYLGAEALKPFLDRADRGIIALCRTSNPGAGEFQDLNVSVSIEEVKHLSSVHATPFSMGVGGCFTTLSVHVAYQVSQEWNKNGNCALVVGATYSHELESVRKIIGDMPILIPGIGFQQKGVPLEEQVKQVVDAGKDSRGWGMIINSSRGIIFASKGADFAEAARRETEKLRDLINRYRQ